MKIIVLNCNKVKNSNLINIKSANERVARSGVTEQKVVLQVIEVGWP